MFDNKFTKRDPLAESVRQVMIENDIRRQVELTLNEQLGIQSRKQLPHELHESYDATLNAAIHNALNENCSWSKGKMEEDKSLVGNQKELDVSGPKGRPDGKLSKADFEELGNRSKEKSLQEKATEAQQEKIHRTMSEYEKGKLHSGSKKGPEVTDPKQAVAIALSQAGLSKKSKQKQVNESVQAILEEIRSNLQEQFVYIYENYDDSVMEQFINSLTEEQAELLGLNELRTLDLSGAQRRFNVQKATSGSAGDPEGAGLAASISASRAPPTAMGRGATPGSTRPATRTPERPTPETLPRDVGAHDKEMGTGAPTLPSVKSAPIPDTNSLSRQAGQSTPRTPSVGNADISPPAGGGDIGIKPSPSFRQSEIDSMKKLDNQTATVKMPDTKQPPTPSSGASGGSGTSGGASRPAPAERPQRQQRSSDSGSSFSGPSGRAGFGNGGSDFGG